MHVCVIMHNRASTFTIEHRHSTLPNRSSPSEETRQINTNTKANEECHDNDSRASTFTSERRHSQASVDIQYCQTGYHQVKDILSQQLTIIVETMEKATLLSCSDYLGEQISNHRFSDAENQSNITNGDITARKVSPNGQMPDISQGVGIICNSFGSLAVRINSIRFSTAHLQEQQSVFELFDLLDSDRRCDILRGTRRIHYNCLAHRAPHDRCAVDIHNPTRDRLHFVSGGKTGISITGK